MTAKTYVLKAATDDPQLLMQDLLALEARAIGYPDDVADAVERG